MLYGGTYSIMIIVWGNRLGGPSSNLGKAVWVLFCANALGKGMDTSLLLPAMGK